MTRRRSHLPRIPVIMWVIAAGLGASPLACSDGESGLVLGRPPASSGGAGAGLGSAGSVNQLGGEAGEPSSPGGAASAEPVAGGGGESGAPPAEDTWVEELCTPTVSFENQTPTADGQAFDDAVSNPAQLLWTATRAVCRTLFRSASDVPAVPEVSLTVGPFDGGVAGTGERAIILSDAYLRSQADAGADVLREITGILYFQASFLYQNAGRPEESEPTRWVRYGIADFVRLRGGYLSRGATAPPAESWSTTSSQTVAFFFDYLSMTDADFVPALNRRLAPSEAPWTDDAFTALTGQELGALWEGYRGTF